MAAPYWKGYLKLSLVTCPVAMMPATTVSEKITFHTLNRSTGNRIRSRYVDSQTGELVDDEDEVKGYETEEGKFLTFTDDELDSVALESVRTIDIDMFAPEDSVPWVYHDSPYYLTPNDKVGEEAFAVIRDAMAKKGVVGISRLVLARRERTVMLQPRDGGIILWTLRFGNEVRDPETYFKDVDAAKPQPKLLAMISQLIEERSAPWDPDFVKDPVQLQLKQIIASKKKKAPARKKASAKEEPKNGSNVVDLMQALKASLEKKAKSK
jgi:DNA end-binding protein Ku